MRSVVSALVLGLMAVTTVDGSCSHHNSTSSVQSVVEFNTSNETVVEQLDGRRQLSLESALNYEELPTGFKRPERQLSLTYLPRGQPITNDKKKDYEKKYGKWNLKYDEKIRWSDFENDPFAKYPNRDIPFADLPDNAWHKNKKYMEQFLKEGVALVDRAMEAILAEYGKGKDEMPDKEFNERAAMFLPDVIAYTTINQTKFGFARDPISGGWTTPKTQEGLKRRLLHAIMTEDTWTFVMGGHSAAAGHGNHYQQSYTLQFQKIMEPIFARLGVLCEAHNVGMGGLGTIMNGMGGADIYGKDIDMFLWDSGMTEKQGEFIDAFYRPAIIAGNRVPILWGGYPPHLRQYFLEKGQEIEGMGSGLKGIPEVKEEKEKPNVPWPSWCLKSSGPLSQVCDKTRFNSTCWIPRKDGFKPPTQKDHPGSQVRWHPAWRVHQLKGRILSFRVLLGLRDALTTWQKAPDYQLADEDWHVTELYNKLKAAWDNEQSLCKGVGGYPNSFCTKPVHARTEFTPRNDPRGTSIRSIMKGNFIPKDPPNIYDPPDDPDPLPYISVPDFAVDAQNIIEAGVPFPPNRGRFKAIHRRLAVRPRNQNLDKFVSKTIQPGKGMGLQSLSASDNCDGTYDSFCGRSWDNSCLLIQHNDKRGCLLFDSYSGWIVMNLADMELGTIVVKIETWHSAGENPATKDFQCENNEKCENAKAAEQGLADGADAGGDAGKRTRSRTLQQQQQQGSNSSKYYGEDKWMNFGKQNETLFHHWSSEDETSYYGDGESSSNHLRGRRSLTDDYSKCEAFEFHFAIDGKITTWNAEEFNKQDHSVQRVVNIWVLANENKDITKGKKKDVELAIRMTGCKRDKTFGLTHVYWQ